MSFKNLFLSLDLQLFAEGGAGAGDGGTAAGGATGVNGTDAASQSGVTPADAVSEGSKTAKKGVKTNPLANVRYGVQKGEAEGAQAAAVQEQETPAGETSQADREAEFTRLIEGEYKDLFQAKTQEIVRARVREAKTASDQQEAMNEAISPILDLLGRKYGVDPKDVKALGVALENDDAMFEAEAEKHGMTAQAYRKLVKAENEANRAKRLLAERSKREQADRDYAAWSRQADETKAFYPDFDLRTELKNEQFRSLLKANIDVKNAYEMVHRDELMTAAVAYASQKAEDKVANRVRANAVRPSENGMASPSSAVTKSDVSQLSKADLKEIERRVMRGEKISFS
ncbi:MAG: hypothetical protein IJD10_07075 [Clostridia bacterium]|nr:hypothetical protein [Clostridia bacterium]